MNDAGMEISLREIAIFKRRLFWSALGMIPAAVALCIGSALLFGTETAGIVALLVYFLVAPARYLFACAKAVCPRCGRRFFCRFDSGTSATGFWPIRRTCFHCGLALPGRA